MTGRSTQSFVIALVVLAWSLALFATSNGAWMANVPQRERERFTPDHDHQGVVASGRHIFLDHCAHCHGADAEGTKKRPSLKSARVQQEATEGDLHWLLVNGNRGQGMPSWIKLGDPQIWQVICYVKSLH
jgi:mono/diheme cytochrome c family protein